MSSFNTLFTLDKANTLVINKPEIRGIPEYQALFIRDTGSKGDIAGTRKKRALKWFMYIYLVMDIRSMYSALPLEERKEKAVLNCNFDKDYKFKEDRYIKEAMVRYKKDMKLSSTAKSFLAAEKALYTMGEDLNFLQEQIIHNKRLLLKKYRELCNLEEISPEDAGLLNESQTLIDNLSKSQDKVNILISKFPKAKKTVDDLLAQFKEEEGAAKELHGGGTLGNREE